MKEKIFLILSNIMEMDLSKITENSSSKNVENWDSLRHMNMIVSIEEEFDIELTDEQIMEMNSYKEIEQVINGLK